MSGKIRKTIDEIIQKRSKGNLAIAEMTIAKLILKGLNPNKFDSDSPDDPVVMEKLFSIAKQLNVDLMEEKEMDIKAVFSVKSLEEEAVSDIKTQLSRCNAKFILYFASSSYDQDRLSSLMQQAFENCIVIGCSAAREITSGELLENSVVAMAVNSNIIADVKVEVIEHISGNLNFDSAFSSFEKYYNESLYTMDAERYVGLVLIDGISKKEEKVMDLIGNRTNVFFIGGSAGDDLKFMKTYVCANGKAYNDSAVLILLKIDDNAEFSIIKTQSFAITDYVLTASKVNEEQREVIEFNGKPAVLAYKDAVGAYSNEDVSKYFMTNPIGLIINENETFVRSPQQIRGTSIMFYCNILKGMDVRVLKSTDIIEDTKKAVYNKMNELGRISGIINFDCILRILELEKKNITKQYAEIFKDIPTIGFSTYGEEFIGHMNQTATMLVFKSKI